LQEALHDGPIDDALGKARSQQKRGHEAELLILLGKLASQTGNDAAHDRNLTTYVFGEFSMAGNLFAVYKPHRATSSQI
jgi:hypothetical protein